MVSYKKPFATNRILWNVVQRGCGAGDVYIESKATAALYTYTPYQPNQAALANMYGLGDHCSAYGNRNFWRVWNDWFGSTQHSRPLISFRSHSSYIGWTGVIHNRGITGVTGQSKAMQALTIDGEVTYTSYSNERGWQPTVQGSMQSGTTGLGRPITAVKIQPTGTLAQAYDIYYRAHVSYIGWMSWAKNGEVAGATGGANNAIEAIEIKLVRKGTPTPESSGVAYKNIATHGDSSPLKLSLSSHVGMVGWQPEVRDEMMSGTTGQSRRIEAIKASLHNTTGLPGNIQYSSHVSYVGWQDWKQAGDGIRHHRAVPLHRGSPLFYSLANLPLHTTSGTEVTRNTSAGWVGLRMANQLVRLALTDSSKHSRCALCRSIHSACLAVPFITQPILLCPISTN